MSFIWPPMLLALLIVPVGIWAARRIDERRHARLASLGSNLGRGGAGTAAPATGSRPLTRGRVAAAIPSALVVASLVLFAVALARPQANVALPRVEGTVVLTFDVSASMAADD